MYATYYDAMIHAEETGQSTLPKLYELAGTAHQGIVESLVSPNSFEPDWDPFHYQLGETDAKAELCLAAGRLAAPERTDYRAESTRSSRLVLLRSL